jgi:serine/threonine protein phosphatase PrpC
MDSLITAHGLTDVGGNPLKENQDTFFTAARAGGEVLLGVFDGHGAHGLPVATAARDVFQGATAEQLTDVTSLFRAADDAVREAILSRARALGRADVRVEPDGTLVYTDALARRQVLQGGTTASLVRVKGLDVEVSHVGDSEVMVIHEDSREFTVLTKDHSSTSVEEWKRVISETPVLPSTYFDTAGGAYGPRGAAPRPVFTLGEEGKWVLNPAGGFYVRNVQREWAAYVSNADSTLNMFRTVGDFALRKNGVNFLPDVIQHRLKSVGRSFVLVASDGLFDPLQYEAIRDTVLEAAAAPAATAESITAAVLAAGLMEGKKHFGRGQDNTTVAVAVVEPRCALEVSHGDAEAL